MPAESYKMLIPPVDTQKGSIQRKSDHFFTFNLNFTDTLPQPQLAQLAQLAPLAPLALLALLAFLALLALLAFLALLALLALLTRQE